MTEPRQRRRLISFDRLNKWVETGEGRPPLGAVILGFLLLGALTYLIVAATLWPVRLLTAALVIGLLRGLVKQWLTEARIARKSTDALYALHDGLLEWQESRKELIDRLETINQQTHEISDYVHTLEIQQAELDKLIDEAGAQQARPLRHDAKRRYQAIVDYARQYPAATHSEIAHELGTSTKTVARALRWDYRCKRGEGD